MRHILKGSTDQSVVIRIVDSGDGTPETGVVFNTAGIDLWYRREGATKTSITEATLSALNDAHSDGGILHIGDGYYRLDLPDAAVATASNGVMVAGTVTGMVVIGCYVSLVDFALAGQSALDLKDFADDGYDPATNKVQGVVLVDTATTLTTLPAITANWLTAAGINADAFTAAKFAADVTSEFQAGLATQASVDTIDGIVDSILVDTAEIGAAGAGLTNINLPNQTMDIVGNITGSLSGTVGAVAGNVAGSVGAIATGGITALSLGANAITAASVDSDVATEIATAVLSAGDIDGYTLEGATKIVMAALAGKLSGVSGNAPVFRAADDSKARITATTSADGRTAVTLDATG